MCVCVCVCVCVLGECQELNRSPLLQTTQVEVVGSKKSQKWPKNAICLDHLGCVFFTDFYQPPQGPLTRSQILVKVIFRKLVLDHLGCANKSF